MNRRQSSGYLDNLDLYIFITVHYCSHTNVVRKITEFIMQRPLVLRNLDPRIDKTLLHEHGKKWLSRGCYTSVRYLPFWALCVCLPCLSKIEWIKYQKEYFNGLGSSKMVIKILNSIQLPETCPSQRYPPESSNCHAPFLELENVCWIISRKLRFKQLHLHFKSLNVFVTSSPYLVPTLQFSMKEVQVFGDV